jgi:hypothetical protein
VFPFFNGPVFLLKWEKRERVCSSTWGISDFGMERELCGNAVRNDWRPSISNYIAEGAPGQLHQYLRESFDKVRNETNDFYEISRTLNIPDIFQINQLRKDSLPTI